MNVSRCWSLWLLAVLVVSVAIASGCGDGRPLRVPVSGQILLDDKPLQDGFVRVIPNMGRSATGCFGADGWFSLTTYEKNDGCVLGKHSVEVVCYDIFNPTVLKPLIPDKYQNVATSDLTITIDEPTDALTIRLSSKCPHKTACSINVGDFAPTSL